ncbi:MAG: Gfo/Idh/MocA family oxidoreductase [Armatimonas sp.]
MSSHPRIAIIGCGQVGNIHRERLLAAGADIVAISDPDADALSRLASRLPRRPKLFRSETDLLASELAEGVVLCTPHGQHAAQIDACLDAGVSVLCEKPFVAESVEARRLVEKAEALGKTLYVSFTRRGRGHARFLEQAARRIGPYSACHSPALATLAGKAQTYLAGTPRSRRWLLIRQWRLAGWTCSLAL